MMTSYFEQSSIDNLKGIDQLPSINFPSSYHNVLSSKVSQTFYQCRICMTSQQNSENPLISPCFCRGSVEFVHFKCMCDWIMRKNHPNQTRLPKYCNAKFTCQICSKQIFYSMNLSLKCKSKNQVHTSIDQSPSIFFLFLLVLLLCLSLLSYDLSVMLSPSKIENANVKMFDLLAMSVAGFLLFFICFLCLYFIIKDFFLKRQGTIQKINNLSGSHLQSPNKYLQEQGISKQNSILSTIHPLQVVITDIQQIQL